MRRSDAGERRESSMFVYRASVYCSLDCKQGAFMRSAALRYRASSLARNIARSVLYTIVNESDSVLAKFVFNATLRNPFSEISQPTRRIFEYSNANKFIVRLKRSRESRDLVALEIELRYS